MKILRLEKLHIHAASLFSLISLGVLFTGCGNILNPSVEYAPASAINTKGTNETDVSLPSLGYDPNQFNCPIGFNVFPKEAAQMDDTDHYSICTSASSGNHSDILLKGKSTSNTICIFPVRETDTGAIQYLLGENSQPYHQCARSIDGGNALFFSVPSTLGSTTYYNALFITDVNTEKLLQSCLISKFSGSQCSSLNINYSYGKFR